MRTVKAIITICLEMRGYATRLRARAAGNDMPVTRGRQRGPALRAARGGYAWAMAAQHNFQAPKGTRDFYPLDAAKRRFIMEAWRNTSIRHGFEEIDGPT